MKGQYKYKSKRVISNWPKFWHGAVVAVINATILAMYWVIWKPSAPDIAPVAIGLASVAIVLGLCAIYKSSSIVKVRAPLTPKGLLT